MKTSITIAFCMFFAIALLTVSCGSQQTEEVAVELEEATASNPLIGVWEIIEVKYPANPEENLEARTIANPQPGRFIFTKNHYSWQMVSPDTPRLDLPSGGGTDEELLEVMSQYTSNGGTYVIDAQAITIKATVAKLPFVMAPDTSLTFNYKLEGEDLVLTTQDLEASMPEEYKMTRLE